MVVHECVHEAKLDLCLDFVRNASDVGSPPCAFVLRGNVNMQCLAVFWLHMFFSFPFVCNLNE